MGSERLRQRDKGSGDVIGSARRLVRNAPNLDPSPLPVTQHRTFQQSDQCYGDFVATVVKINIGLLGHAYTHKQLILY